jgi:hypothetical protein
MSRAFLIGVGPSLGKYPTALLEALSGEETYCSAKIAFWNECPFVPKHLLVTERRAMLRMPDIEEAAVRWPNVELVAIRDEPVTRSGWTHKTIGPSGDRDMQYAGFSAGPLFKSGACDVLTGMQLAWERGYREFFLLGTEFLGYGYVFGDTFPNGTWDASRAFAKERLNEVLASAHKTISFLYENDGNVFDCSPSGLLNEPFNFLPLEEVLGTVRV